MDIQKIKVSNVNNIQAIKVNNDQQIIINMDLQDKVVTPTQEQQVIKPDVDFDALSKVIVEPIPDDYTKVEGTFDITKNGEYDVKSYAGVNVDVQSKLGTKTIDKNGVYNANDDNLDGYESVVVETSGVDINEYFDTTYDNTSPNYWVRDNFSLKLPDIIVDDNVTSLANFVRQTNYKSCPKIIGGDNVTNMSYMYYSNTFTEIDVSGLKTDKATTMEAMFGALSNVTVLDLNNFNTSNVKNMAWLFYSSSKLSEIYLNELDVSNVTDMNRMFQATAITNIDVSKWNVEKVANMNQMFRSTNLVELDLSNWRPLSVTDLGAMFRQSANLTKLNLSNWDFSKVSSTTAMFYGCDKLTTLIIDSQTILPLTSTDVFTSTPIANGTGYVYVSDDMVETYKADTNWAIYANQIKGVSELPAE